MSCLKSKATQNKDQRSRNSSLTNRSGLNCTVEGAYNFVRTVETILNSESVLKNVFWLDIWFQCLDVQRNLRLVLSTCYLHSSTCDSLTNTSIILSYKSRLCSTQTQFSSVFSQKVEGLKTWALKYGIFVQWDIMVICIASIQLFAYINSIYLSYYVKQLVNFILSPK